MKVSALGRASMSLSAQGKFLINDVLLRGPGKQEVCFRIN